MDKINICFSSSKLIHKKYNNRSWLLGKVQIIPKRSRLIFLYGIEIAKCIRKHRHAKILRHKELFTKMLLALSMAMHLTFLIAVYLTINLKLMFASLLLLLIPILFIIKLVFPLVPKSIILMNLTLI